MRTMLHLLYWTSSCCDRIRERESRAYVYGNLLVAMHHAVLTGLDPDETYTVKLFKRNEPAMKGAMAKYSPVQLFAFLANTGCQFLPASVCALV